MKRGRWGTLFVAGALFSACSSDNANPFHKGEGADASCPDGTEQCPCYPNDTCNHGLSCESGACVRTPLPDASVVDAPATGGRSMGTAGASAGAGGGAASSHDGGREPKDAARTPGSDGNQGSGGSTGGSSSADGGASHGDGALPAANPVAIFIMLDRSSSMVMTAPGATTDSWSNAVSALTIFVNDSASKGIDVGLGTFPVGANNTFDCTAGTDCGTPVVPIAPLPANATPLLDAMTAQVPAGLAFTPTECALRGMINECLTYMANSPSGERCVAVLVTDGTPTQCDTTEADLTAIIADGKAKGVETFALGLAGADVGVLDQYAVAGGSTSAIDVSGGPAPLAAALKKVRESSMGTIVPADQ